MLKHTEKNEFALGSVLISGMLGMVGGILISLLLSLVFCGMALAFDDPRGAIEVFAYAVLALGSVCAGLVAMRTDEGRSYVSSLIAGVMYVLVLFVISLFMRGDGTYSPLLRTVVFALMVGMSMLGGAIGKGRRERARGGKNSPGAQMRRRLTVKK